VAKDGCYVKGHLVKPSTLTNVMMSKGVQHGKEEDIQVWPLPVLR
jgi:hypothetical protein